MRFLVAILLLLIAVPAWAQQGQGMSQAIVVSSCGGGALPSGPVTQLTMDTSGRLCQSGIGSNICSQATAYLGRTTGTNEGGNAVNITALICGLVTDGVWASLDAFYVTAQQNQADALLNLVGTSYSLTGNTTLPTFTSYRGFGPFTSGNGIINGFFPPGSNFTQNSANLGIWTLGIVAEASQLIGNGSGSGASHIYAHFTDGNFYPRVNSNSTPGVPSPGTSGLYVGDRPSSTTVIPYWNGTPQASQSSASQSPAPSVFAIGTLGALSGQVIAEAHIGGSLGGAGNLALYNRLRTYLTAVGAP